jgi:hypothetical protein
VYEETPLEEGEDGETVIVTAALVERDEDGVANVVRVFGLEDEETRRVFVTRCVMLKPVWNERLI